MVRSKRKPTLREIAGALNVNVSTVSRALAGDPGVGEDRAREIRQLADRLGYRPRPLRRSRTGAIGLLVATDRPGQPDDLFQQRIIVHVGALAARRQLHVHLEFIARADARDAVPGIVEQNRVDGVLLSGHPPEWLCSRLASMRLPAVAIHDTVARTGLSCVTVDLEPAMADLVGRLIESGHRRMVLAIGQARFPTVAARAAAFTRAAGEGGLTTDDARVIEGIARDLSGGRDLVQRVMDGSRRPTALLFQNDLMAIGAMMELSARGIRCPADASVAGHDDTLFAAQTAPGLTSIDIREGNTVDAALSMLAGFIDNGVPTDPREDAASSVLVWRESCGPVRST